MRAEEWILRSLRATRAAPPLRAGEDEYRRVLYGAALEQFEQLLIAAEAVGPAARPLPLFYAMSQAGRAIVAARGEAPDVRGHGLSEAPLAPPPDDLLHRQIRRSPRGRGDDAFGAVSRAIGSPDIKGPVHLGAVWTALRDTHYIPKGSWLPEWRPAIAVLDDTPSRTADGQFRVQIASYSGNPHHDEVPTLQERYPALPPGAAVATKEIRRRIRGSWIAVLTWPDTHALDAIAPAESLYDRDRYLVPTLPGESEVVHDLMMWWLLLFGLSIFARYHPGLWMKSLDVDRSTMAVPLEAVLDRALVVVPSMVHEVLIG